MFRIRHTLLATTLLLAACAGNDYGPSLGSVPNMPSLDNDRAVEQDAQLKQARVEALSRRMDTMKETGAVTPAIVEEVEEAKAEVAVVAKEVAAAPVIERPVINSDPDAILKRDPETVSARLKEATRKRAPEPKAAPKKAAAPVEVAKPAVVEAKPAAEAPIAEVINTAPAEALMTQPSVGAAAEVAPVAATAAAVAVVAAPVEAAAPKNVDVKLPPLGQFRVYLGEFTFARNQKALGEADLERLSEILQPLLNREVQGTFLVEGYASVDTKRTLKGDLSNMVLSMERASALEEGLKFMGVESGRIRVQALGQTNPHKLAGNRPRAVLWLIQ